jgi:hypothetical protein
MKVCGGVEIQLQTFLISALGGGYWWLIFTTDSFIQVTLPPAPKE